MIIVVLIVFFCLQGFVLFCCLAAGDDPGSQEVSDQEQMEYIEMWMEKKKEESRMTFLWTIINITILPFLTNSPLFLSAIALMPSL